MSSWKHCLAFVSALVVTLALRAQDDIARFELSVTERDKHSVFTSAVQHGRFRYEQCLCFEFGAHLYCCEHPGLEQIAGVVKFHPDLHGAGFFIDSRINISHTSAERAVRQVGQSDIRLLAEFHKG